MANDISKLMSRPSFASLFTTNLALRSVRDQTVPKGFDPQVFEQALAIEYQEALLQISADSPPDGREMLQKELAWLKSPDRDHATWPGDRG